jgi:RNA polymerase sigma-70 factor (ECF subfamily)
MGGVAGSVPEAVRYGAADQADHETVLSVLAGEREAFRGIVTRYQQSLYRLARNAQLGHEDAEEAVQTAFLKAFRSLSGYDNRRKFHSWLYTIMINTIRTRLRKRRLERFFVHPGGAVGERELAVAPGREPAPDEVLATAESQARVRRALQAVPDRYRIPLVLHYLEEHPVLVVAEMLGLPENTVKTRLRRGRTALLAAIERDPELETFFRGTGRVSIGEAVDGQQTP